MSFVFTKVISHCFFSYFFIQKWMAVFLPCMPALDHCPGAFQITGNVVYHGEVWVDRDHRSGGIAPLTCRLAHGLALIKWAPDYIYGLITDRMILVYLETARNTLFLVFIPDSCGKPPHHIP